MTYYIAVDIGASSGRVILAQQSDGLDLQEVHRFKNGFEQVDDHDRWNITELIKQIFIGLEKVKALGVESATLGIDTWAVDYCLIDQSGQLLAQPISYRDKRTKDAMAQVFEKIPAETIYDKTGIQFLNFNTLYQLYVEERELLAQADKILLIPDYIAYVLTGKIVGEVSNVSTTQLLNLGQRDYDSNLLEALQLTKDKFPTLVETGQSLGKVKSEYYVHYDLPKIEVIAVATHDTASAVVGVPATSGNWAYLSSGTWSLIGVENHEPLASQEAYQANYTNEWGAYQTYRFLKNITGMWCVQEIARLYDYRYSFREMAEQARQVEPFQQTIDVNDERFTNPANMIEEIQAACREKGEPVPETVGELVMCVYSSLAKVYAREWQELERLTGRSLDKLHIVGGGSNVALLNQLTANSIGKPVLAGPGEATAIGNILVQMISKGTFTDLADSRNWLAKSINLTTYYPE